MPSTLAAQHRRPTLIAPQSRQRADLPPIPTQIFLEPDWSSAADPTWGEEEDYEPGQVLETSGG